MATVRAIQYSSMFCFNSFSLHFILYFLSLSFSLSFTIFLCKKVKERKKKWNEDDKNAVPIIYHSFGCFVLVGSKSNNSNGINGFVMEIMFTMCLGFPHYDSTTENFEVWLYGCVLFVSLALFLFHAVLFVIRACSFCGCLVFFSWELRNSSKYKTAWQ